jgi:hypothetical protein
MAAIAVVVNGGGSGIQPMAPMAAWLTVAAVDGGGDDGIFTNASHDNNHHPCPHARAMAMASRVAVDGNGDSDGDGNEAGG